MNRLPAPPGHLLRFSAGIFIPLLVVPNNRTVRLSHPGELRNRVSERPKLPFSLLRALPR